MMDDIELYEQDGQWYLRVTIDGVVRVFREIATTTAAGAKQDDPAQAMNDPDGRSSIVGSPRRQP